MGCGWWGTPVIQSSGVGEWRSWWLCWSSGRSSGDTEDAFLTHWREEFRIDDRRGLVGEFMCGPGTQDYVTWSLPDPDDPPCTIFVNVAFWVDDESFRKQVEPNFNDDRKLESFEAACRVRTVFEPVCWRRGLADLPPQNSMGVR